MIRVSDTLPARSAVVGFAFPDSPSVDKIEQRFRVEVVHLAEARLPEMTQIRIHEVADLGQRAIDVEAVPLVGNDE